MRIPAPQRSRVSPIAAILALPFLTSFFTLGQGVPKIMPLGDSITWGAHRTETVPGGYRRELSNRLTAAGITFDFVGHGTGNPAPGVDPHHNGNNGIRTDQVLTNIQTWLTTAPDVVLMKLGTNDMLQKVPVHVAAENIRTLIHRITDNAPNRRLYVATIIPIVETRDGRTAAEWAPIVDAYNAEVRKLVAEHATQGRKVRLAEVRNGITYTFPNSSENFFQPTDGTHPATAGYRQLGAYWFSTITAGGSVYDPPAVGYPNVPTNLAATIGSGTHVNLSWTDTSGNEGGFKIYRTTGTTGTWAHVATAPANATGYAVTGLSTANTFYQFAVSATNGSGDSAWSRSVWTTPANVALNRTATATSVFSSSHVAARANDNNASTLWASATNDTAPAWRVDLGGSYQIHRVEILFRQDSDQPAARRNFEIQASNDPSFASYQVIGSQGSTTLMHAATFAADVTNSTGFAHVRVRKTDGGQFSFSEVRVYGSPAGGQSNVVTLDVSSSPQNGVSVTATPADRNGAAGGVTTFSRSYNRGTSVTLTAPASSGSGNFVKWQLNGTDHSTNPTLAVTLNSNSTLTAVYGNGTVNSSLTNGSFESGYTGWTHSGNHSIQTAALYAPPNGSSVLAFNSANAVPNGVLTQTIATTPGTSCTVSFDMGTYSFNTLAQKLQFTVNGNGNLLTRDLTMNGQGNGAVRWTRHTFDFTANSAATTLTFRDTSTATNAIDLLLDHVRVTVGSGSSGAPVASADSYSTTRDTVLTVPSPGVLANDSDPQGTPLTAVINSSPSHGSLSLNPNGGFTYTPENGYTGTDSFAYHARDGALDSNVVTVTLTINPPGSTTLTNGGFESDFSGWTTSGNVSVGTAPTYSATEGAKLAYFNGGNTTPNGQISRALSTTPGNAYTLSFDVGVLSYNRSSQTLGLSITGSSPLLNQSITLTGSGNGTIWQAQSFSFTANSATTTLAFRDLSTATNALDLLLDNVRITVGTGTSDAPVATADSYSTTRDTVLTVPSPGVLANDSAAQGTPLTAVLNSSPSHGSLSLNANGSFAYTPEAGYSGTDSFTYRARDGSLDSNVVTVTLTINPPGSTTLTNGGFESDFSGWTTSGNVAIGTTPTYVATEGAKLAFFNGANTSPNGTISRAITTNPGQTYTLAFDVGVLSYNRSAQNLGVTATGSGTLLSQTIGLTGSGNGTLWQARSYTFTANTATTTLTFRDLSTATNSLDLLLDNVRITSTSTAPAMAAPPAAASAPAAARAAVTPDPSEAPAQPSFSLSKETITLTLHAAVPGTYMLERSENLSNWETVWTRQVTEPGTLEFTEPKPEAGGNAFYRFALLK